MKFLLIDPLHGKHGLYFYDAETTEDGIRFGVSKALSLHGKQDGAEIDDKASSNVSIAFKIKTHNGFIDNGNHGIALWEIFKLSPIWKS